MLELIEEALDEIALAIKRKVARPLDLAVGLRWDDRSDLKLGKGIDEWISVVGLIANQSIRVGVLDQRFRACKRILDLDPA